jgi:hypothetical protein
MVHGREANLESPAPSAAPAAPAGGEPAAAASAAAPSVEALRPGDRVGEYVLEAPLGDGGSGAVWRARHAVLPGKVVAVKVLRDRTMIELLRGERASVLERARDQPGVLRVLAIELDGPVPHLAEEYAAGGDLASYLRRRGKLPLDHALGIFHEVASIVARAHARGLVHGDLKPANILLDGEGRVRLGDFGLGLAMAASAGAGAAPREDRGRRDYAPPEAHAAGGPIDARADVWSLGVLLYELLTGELPAGRVGLEAISGALDACFARAWTAYDARYRDAGELLADLERLCGGKPRDAGGGDPSTLRRAVLEPQRGPAYTPSGAFWNRVLVLIPVLALVSALCLVWFQEDDGGAVAPAAATQAAARRAGEPAVISRDEALRLGEMRRAIESGTLDIPAALALLNSFVAEADDLGLREKAIGWRDALASASQRREYEVRLKGFAIDRDAYRERFHSRFEPGNPDVYVRVYHTVDGREARVFDTSEETVEAWTHVWKPSAEAAVPSFRIRWRAGDGIRVELREADVLGDNTIAEFRADGGCSIFVLSSPRKSAEGHEIEIDSDFPFGK